MPLNYLEKGLDRAVASSKYILCGEDDKDDQDLLAEIFSTVDESFSIFFVNNGRRVIVTLDQLPDNELPCLLLLDYNMPELNGAEILKELNNHARYDAIPKIIWSTSAADKFKQMCLNLGAMDYFTKPSNVRDITEAVQRMISFC